MRMVLKVMMSVFFAAFFASCPAWARESYKYWEFSKEIDVRGLSKKTAAVPLDANVYNYSRPDLRDLRVIDNKAGECPYALFKQGETVEEKELRTKTVSQEYSDTENISVVELVNPQAAYNSVEIVPEDRNFARKVTLEGSDDRLGWKVIRKDVPVYYFNFSAHYDYFENFTGELYTEYGFANYTKRNLRFDFPESRYRFLKVRIPHDLDKEPVRLTGARVYRTVRGDAAWDAFKGTVKDTRVEPGTKSAETTFDLGWKNIPVSKVELKASGTNFFRKVEIDSSDDLKAWKRIGRGMLFSIMLDNEKEENLALKVNETPCRYIKVRVFNGDNKPLPIPSILAYVSRRSVVILPDAGSSYKLLYGNQGGLAVAYDTAELIKGKAFEAFGNAALGPEVRNPDFVKFKEKKPWTEDRPYLLWSAMLVIMAGLVALGARVIRKVDVK